VIALLLAVSNPLTPLEDALLWVLEQFHGLGLTWAWSIVATTIAVRILLVPLTVKQIHSMQSLQRHAPEMKEIQKKYKGDRQKLNEELMKFYKENKINPAASCLPLLAQLPVFFALFFVLRDFSDDPPCSLEPASRCVERGDFGWLNIVPSVAENTLAHWSGYVLLVIYVASQVLSTWYMSATMEKTQRWIMMILPLVAVGFVVNFPSGLLLYWMTTNLWTVGQGLITRQLVPKKGTLPPPPGPKRSSRTPPASPPPGDDEAGNGAESEAPKPKPVPPARTTPRRVKRKKGSARR
jgi:YidC/Oxa1 family membrane protein insertase